MVKIIFDKTEQKFIMIGKDDWFKYYIMINDIMSEGYRYMRIPSDTNYKKLTYDEVYDLGGEFQNLSFKVFE